MFRLNLFYMYFNLTVFQLVLCTPPKLKHGGPQNDGPFFVYVSPASNVVENHARQIGSFPQVSGRKFPEYLFLST